MIPKKGKAQTPDCPAFPHNTEKPYGLPSYRIMNHNEFFKQNFLFQRNFHIQYEKEARSFQSHYNSVHPSHRIWRHQLYLRTFFFYRNGFSFSIQVRVVRFIFAGTGKTFTFYGSLFSAFSRFSKELISQIVSDHTDPFCTAASLVSSETAAHWKALWGSRFFCTFSPAYDKTIKASLDIPPFFPDNGII
ncbi:MAG: hypothetical protein ACI4EO_01540 [Blautia sp.]